jgi:hypothetical protein
MVRGKTTEPHPMSGGPGLRRNQMLGLQNRVSLGTGHYTFGSLDPGGAGSEARHSGWISTIGLNYRFTGFDEAPAVVAKY